MCNCKSTLEAKLAENFSARHPGATDIKVTLQGYGFTVVDNKLTMRPFMSVTARAVVPSKGNPRLKTFKENMVFNYCPFCAEKC